jgi:hypothetical protein
VSTVPPLVFVQYLTPPLRSGVLTLTATQAVAAPGGQGETFAATQELFVKGARDQLDDAAIDSCFPPAGNQGEFANLLPHVVLTQPTLPWQRSPSPAPADPRAAAGEPVRTWLGLLLFDETDPPPKPVAMTIADLHGGGPVFVPARLPEPGELPTDPVTAIDVPVDLFNRIAPTLADLEWSAHVRQSAIAAKAAAPGAVPGGEYAVVFGNRLPTPGRTSTVHVVSLEGFAPHLPAADGREPAVVPSGVSAVRLVTLRSWTFSTIALEQTFAGVLGAVDIDPPGLQLPYAAAASPVAPAVSTAFGLGYTALDHELRDGGHTVSWYRGPLAPLAPAPRPAFAPASSADQLLRYDPQSGMFDVSYASAWELGRMLGLHDRAYATALYRWKLHRTQQEANALELEILDAALPTQPAPAARTPEHRFAHAVRTLVGPAVAALAKGGAMPRPLTEAPRLTASALAARLAAPAALAAGPIEAPVAGTDESQVIAWLTQLHLLVGVPFNYLVPDIHMLPAEAIRFFGVDEAWVAALIDGAFGICESRVAASVAAALRPRAGAAARAGLPAVRRALLGLAGDEPPPVDTLSGFLLRSGVVAGWPGLEVHGYADPGAAQPLGIVRLERIAPSLLLCIFAGRLARVDFQEPPEGIHFGVDPAPAPARWRKQLRYADGSATATRGSPIPGENAAVTLRAPPADNTVCLDTLARAMAGRVWAQEPVPPPSAFTAAEFGLEMVEGPETVSFQVTT